ncbi:MAG: hypothetical protein P8J14_01965 [Emcibacteraceae bacterium]|nr:hypothetical protein [Emcibacteraceae bacterium]
MDRYSFVMMMMSIIVGLGVTELLRNIARQIQSRAGSKQYWLHSVIAALIFVSLLQTWWESWGLRNIDNWNFLIVLMMLGGPVGIYIISHLLFPEQVKGADFEKHYFKNSRAISVMGMLVVIVSSLFRPISFDTTIFEPSNIPSVFMFVAFLSMALTKMKMLHQIIYPTLLILALLDVLIFQFSI